MWRDDRLGSFFFGGSSEVINELGGTPLAVNQVEVAHGFLRDLLDHELRIVGAPLRLVDDPVLRVGNHFRHFKRAEDVVVVLDKRRGGFLLVAGRI